MVDGYSQLRPFSHILHVKRDLAHTSYLAAKTYREDPREDLKSISHVPDSNGTSREESHSNKFNGAERSNDFFNSNADMLADNPRIIPLVLTII